MGRRVGISVHWIVITMVWERGHLAIHHALVRHVERDSEVGGRLGLVDAAPSCTLVAPAPQYIHVCVCVRSHHNVLIWRARAYSYITSH